MRIFEDGINTIASYVAGIFFFFFCRQLWKSMGPNLQIGHRRHHNTWTGRGRGASKKCFLGPGLKKLWKIKGKFGWDMIGIDACNCPTHRHRGCCNPWTGSGRGASKMHQNAGFLPMEYTIFRILLSNFAGSFWTPLATIHRIRSLFRAWVPADSRSSVA